MIKKNVLLALLPLSYLVLLLFQKDLSMEGDLGRHLKLGDIIVHCFCVPQTNLFSYVYPHFPIVQHEWFAEVVLYLTSAFFGLQGLLILKMVLIIISASLLYSVALKKGSLFWVTVFSILCITIFSMRFFVLPELFSYLFISLFIFIIEKVKLSKKTSLLWLLPVLELLWVNMHLYFIIGIVIFGFYYIETLISEKKFNKNLTIIGLCLILVTLLNPSGLRGALLPFTFQQNYGFVVEENESPLTILNPGSTSGTIAYTAVLQVLVFEILIGLFIICFFLRRNWKNYHLGNATVAAGLALKFTRCIALFSLFSFIPFVQTFTQIEEKIKKESNYQMNNLIKGIVVIGVVIVVSIHISGLFSYQILGFGFVPSAENAVAFIQSAGVKGRIFNNYVIGNYLIYKLYPQEKVYVDARPEAYPASFFTGYWRMMSDPQYFNNQVKKYNINAVVFNVADDDPSRFQPFLLRLINSSNWIPVYADGTVSIFVRNNSVNAAVIRKYKIKDTGDQ